MNKLGIDLDGCLADFNLSYGRLFIDIGEENKFGADWEARLAATEFPRSWDWETQAGYSPEVTAKVWKAITKSDNFWSSLAPYPGTAQVVKRLNQLANGGNEVYFLTNRMGSTVKLQSEKWLYAQGMNYPTVLVAADKLPIIQSLGLNFFIDDKPSTIQEVSAANIPGLHLYMRKHPYNFPGIYNDNVHTCTSVLEALTETYGL